MPLACRSGSRSHRANRCPAVHSQGECHERGGDSPQARGLIEGLSGVGQVIMDAAHDADHLRTFIADELGAMAHIKRNPTQPIRATPCYGQNGEMVTIGNAMVSNLLKITGNKHARINCGRDPKNCLGKPCGTPCTTFQTLNFFQMKP